VCCRNERENPNRGFCRAKTGPCHETPGKILAIMKKHPSHARKALGTWWQVWMIIVMIGPIAAVGAAGATAAAGLNPRIAAAGFLGLTSMGIVWSSIRLAAEIRRQRGRQSGAHPLGTRGGLEIGLALGGGAIAIAIFFGACLLVMFSPGSHL
jgi:hypothetical protein